MRSCRLSVLPISKKSSLGISRWQKNILAEKWTHSALLSTRNYRRHDSEERNDVRFRDSRLETSSFVFSLSEPTRFLTILSINDRRMVLSSMNNSFSGFGIVIPSARFKHKLKSRLRHFFSRMRIRARSPHVGRSFTW